MDFPEIGTTRLRILPATPALCEAERRGIEALRAALGFEVPEEWPPEGERPLAEHRARVRGDGGPASGWGRHYVALRATEAGGRPLLIGAGGYLGPPDPAGDVAVSCAILGEFQGCGFATEATAALVGHAFADPAVTTVWAAAPPATPAARRLLTRVGFVPVPAEGPPPAGAGPAPSRFCVRRPLASQKKP